MDMRDFVLSRHPSAVLVEVPPIFRGQDTEPAHPGYWVVYAGPDTNAAVLGRSGTSAGAWTEAAARVMSEHGEQVESTVGASKLQ